MKKFLLMFLPLAVLVTGCRYDDSEVWKELNNHENRLLALEKTINTDLVNLQGIVAELQAKVYVNSVTPTADGKGIVLAFSDGKTYTVSNGTDGNTPVIGVKKDTDGNYYWTLNGEWLTDGSGNKIRTTGDQGEPGEAGITPQVKIQDKKWYVSVDGGTTWTEAGDATVVGDSLFKNVKLDDEGKNVIFTFQDDSTITIPVVPVVKKLQLLFDETMIQSIMSGATATVDYTISGPDDETVEFDTFENNGYKVVVTPTNETSGTIAVTAPDPAVKGKVLFILTGSKGSSFVKTVTINANPSLKPEKTEYSVDAKAGEITINVAANVAYTSEIVATKLSAIDWITKGSAENKFNVVENTSNEDRAVDIIFKAEGLEDVTVRLTQAGKDDIVLVTTDPTVEATEGTLDVVITTNVEVTATPDVDWITAVPETKAMANKTFSFNVAANTGVTRTGHIDFTAGELKQTITVTQKKGLDFETIAELNALATATAAEVKGYFNNAVVSFVPAANTAIITDGTASIMYYKSSHGLKQGQTFTGEVNVKVVLYNSLYSELTAIDATFTGDGAEVKPEVVTIADLTADYAKYQNAYVKAVDLLVTGVSGKNITVKEGEKTYVVYNNAGNATNNVGDVITAVGTVTKYSTTEEIKVWKNEDITVTTPGPAITATDITDVAAAGVTNATTTVTLTNNTGWTASVTPDGTVVTAASIDGSTITYTVAANTGSARNGKITVKLAKDGLEASKDIKVSQLGAGGGGGGTDYSKVETSNVTLTKGTNGYDAKVNSNDAIKVGTSKLGGDMKVTVPAGTKKLHVHAAAWSGVTGLVLNITGATSTPTSITLSPDTGISGNSPFTLNGKAEDFYFAITLTDITAETVITFTSATAKRFVVWGCNAE